MTKTWKDPVDYMGTWKDSVEYMGKTWKDPGNHGRTLYITQKGCRNQDTTFISQDKMLEFLLLFLFKIRFAFFY